MCLWSEFASGAKGQSTSKARAARHKKGAAQRAMREQEALGAQSSCRFILISQWTWGLIATPAWQRGQGWTVLWRGRSSIGNRRWQATTISVVLRRSTSQEKVTREPASQEEEKHGSGKREGMRPAKDKHESASQANTCESETRPRVNKKAGETYVQSPTMHTGKYPPPPASGHSPATKGKCDLCRLLQPPLLPPCETRGTVITQNSSRDMSGNYPPAKMERQVQTCKNWQKPTLFAWQ